MCARGELPFDKLAIDLSFEGAWRGWTHRGRFPQVSTDLRNGSNGVWIMLHADERKRTSNLYWETDMRAITARTRGWPDAAIDPVAVAESIDGDLPADAWKELAESFLSRFDRSQTGGS